jgi:hypothetical protein
VILSGRYRNGAIKAIRRRSLLRRQPGPTPSRRHRARRSCPPSRRSTEQRRPTRRCCGSRNARPRGGNAIRRSGKCGAEAWEHVVPFFAFAPSIRKAPLPISCAGYASTASSERIPNSFRYRVTGLRLANRLVLDARLQSLAAPRPCRNPSNAPSSRDRSKNQPYGDAALRIAQPAAGGTGWCSNSRRCRAPCPCTAPSC